jgi:flagellar basal body-associated protein FliL
MKQEHLLKLRDKTSEKPAVFGGGIVLYRCLALIAILLALLIVAVTVYTVISRNLAQGKPMYTIPEKETLPPPLPSVEDNIFSGIGRVRISTGDNQTVIVSIAFPYDRKDIPFAEELVSRITNFRSIAFSFFRSFTSEELRDKGEEAVKAELLHRYNDVLKLGKIPVLYFNDFMIFE